MRRTHAFTVRFNIAMDDDERSEGLDVHTKSIVECLDDAFVGRVADVEVEEVEGRGTPTDVRVFRAVIGMLLAKQVLTGEDLELVEDYVAFAVDADVEQAAHQFAEAIQATPLPERYVRHVDGEGDEGTPGPWYP